MTIGSIQSASGGITSISTGTTWNGPRCVQCGACYLGSHTCSVEDLTRRINELLALSARTGNPSVTSTRIPTNRMASCPCRPENGGSGICGCVLSGPQVTC